MLGDPEVCLCTHAQQVVVPHSPRLPPSLLGRHFLRRLHCPSIQCGDLLPAQVILKPAESTPLTAFALAELARRAGVPSGVLNVLTGDSKVISECCAAA